MPLKFFIIPVASLEASEQELNSFLASHSILAIERHWVDRGANSYWSICIDYRLASETRQTCGFLKNQVKSKIDYRAVLPPEQFIIFSTLRDLRKELAQRDAVPVYTIFTNEQLADMIRGNLRSVSDLERIVGVGDARIAKYGEPFIQAVSKAMATPLDPAPLDPAPL